MTDDNRAQPNDDGTSPEVPPTPTQETVEPKQSRAAEMKANVAHVFGSGIGKILLIVVAFFVFIGLAVGIRGMNSTPAAAVNNSSFDSATPPQKNTDVAAVSEHEGERRKQQSALEAEAAIKAGASYQPEFDPIIEKIADNRADGAASFKVDNELNSGPPKINTGAGDDNSGSEQQKETDTPSYPPPRPPVSEAEKAAQAKYELELKKAIDARDKYVADMQLQTMKQFEGLFGKSQPREAGVNGMGAYSSVSYYSVVKTKTDSGGAGGAARAPIIGGAVADFSLGDPDGKRLIKTGNLMYATLDSEVNTDDGGEVLATIRGGKWDKAKLIGKVEQGPNNIRLKFTIMAPQDGRDTMRVNAIAIREEDAKQGVAEDIDNHILERYGSLAVASLMSGYGKAYAATPGTTVTSPGGVTTQTVESPDSQQVVASALGEMGSSMAAEIRKNFNQPTTYSTPANQGFGVYFMQDVFYQGK